MYFDLINWFTTNLQLTSKPLSSQWHGYFFSWKQFSAPQGTPILDFCEKIKDLPIRLPWMNHSESLHGQFLLCFIAYKWWHNKVINNLTWETWLTRVSECISFFMNRFLSALTLLSNRKTTYCKIFFIFKVWHTMGDFLIQASRLLI